MRSFVALVALVLLWVSASAFFSGTSSAQLPLPRLSVEIHGVSSGTAFLFNASEIWIPQVPIVLNVTFVNADTIPAIVHSFTINDNAGSLRINSGLLSIGNRSQLEFTVNAIDNITYRDVSFAPEAGTRGILFYCIPHRVDVGGQPGGMIGEIVLASTTGAGAGEAPEKGINIRAYWIGMIGIAAMIGWIGISYFVIKSSSPRFRDHKDHLRRGLP